MGELHSLFSRGIRCSDKIEEKQLQCHVVFLRIADGPNVIGESCPDGAILKILDSLKGRYRRSSGSIGLSDPSVLRSIVSHSARKDAIPVLKPKMQHPIGI